MNKLIQQALVGGSKLHQSASRAAGNSPAPATTAESKNKVLVVRDHEYGTAFFERLPDGTEKPITFYQHGHDLWFLLEQLIPKGFNRLERGPELDEETYENTFC